MPRRFAAVSQPPRNRRGTDLSLSVAARGAVYRQSFGDPGFYFTVHCGDGTLYARYVTGMKEQIHVYAAEPGVTRADRTLWLGGIQFLRVHYRMTRSAKV